MSGFQDWCGELEALIQAGAEGEPLNLEAVTALAEQARVLGPELDPAQREHVGKCIAKLADIVREGMAQLDAEIDKLSDRRAGIRGYGQLRSSHVGQRLRRRV